MEDAGSAACDENDEAGSSVELDIDSGLQIGARLGPLDLLRLAQVCMAPVFDPSRRLYSHSA